MRNAGILLHPTSLPSGCLGGDARRFIDWLVKAGMQAWQTLPLVPTGAGGSPYSTVSSAALDPGLAPLELEAPETKDEPWAHDLALFLALRAEFGGPFWTWPEPLRDREPRALALAEARHGQSIARHVRAQAKAAYAWAETKRYANDHGVQIIGDLPIYVDRDSVDVWMHRDAFQLDARGEPLAVAGVPPDYFSETGQLWGNPLYDWAAQKANGHVFWVERMRRALALFDTVRIDHFRAFSAYWAVPPEAKDARGGAWKKGPGLALFDDLKRALGRLPIIAEDLGTLDDDVHALRDALAVPGMAVLQFAFGGDAQNLYLPHNHKARSIVYTGTHDNDTTLGFWRGADERTRDHVRRYLGVDGHDVVWDLIRAAFASVAETAIIPMQDVLGLPSSARMNTPGLSEGNWGYRMSAGALGDGSALRLRELLSLYGRLR